MGTDRYFYVMSKKIILFAWYYLFTSLNTLSRTCKLIQHNVLYGYKQDENLPEKVGLSFEISFICALLFPFLQLSLDHLNKHFFGLYFCNLRSSMQGAKESVTTIPMK